MRQSVALKKHSNSAKAVRNKFRVGNEKIFKKHCKETLE